MLSTDQPIYYYGIDHTTLDIIVKEDIARQTLSVSPELRHPHVLLDPSSRLVIAVTLDSQAVPPALSASNFPEEGS